MASRYQSQSKLYNSGNSSARIAAELKRVAAERAKTPRERRDARHKERREYFARQRSQSDQRLQARNMRPQPHPQPQPAPQPPTSQVPLPGQGGRLPGRGAPSGGQQQDDHMFGNALVKGPDGTFYPFGAGTPYGGQQAQQYIEDNNLNPRDFGSVYNRSSQQQPPGQQQPQAGGGWATPEAIDWVNQGRPDWSGGRPPVGHVPPGGGHESPGQPPPSFEQPRVAPPPQNMRPGSDFMIPPAPGQHVTQAFQDYYNKNTGETGSVGSGGWSFKPGDHGWVMGRKPQDWKPPGQMPGGGGQTPPWISPEFDPPYNADDATFGDPPGGGGQMPPWISPGYEPPGGGVPLPGQDGRLPDGGAPVGVPPRPGGGPSYAPDWVDQSPGQPKLAVMVNWINDITGERKYITSGYGPPRGSEGWRHAARSEQRRRQPQPGGGQQQPQPPPWISPDDPRARGWPERGQQQPQPDDLSILPPPPPPRGGGWGGGGQDVFTPEPHPDWQGGPTREQHQAKLQEINQKYQQMPPGREKADAIQAELREWQNLFGSASDPGSWGNRPGGGPQQSDLRLAPVAPDTPGMPGGPGDPVGTGGPLWAPGTPQEYIDWFEGGGVGPRPDQRPTHRPGGRGMRPGDQSRGPGRVPLPGQGGRLPGGGAPGGQPWDLSETDYRDFGPSPLDPSMQDRHNEKMHDQNQDYDQYWGQVMEPWNQLFDQRLSQMGNMNMPREQTRSMAAKLAGQMYRQTGRWVGKNSGQAVKTSMDNGMGDYTKHELFNQTFPEWQNKELRANPPDATQHNSWESYLQAYTQWNDRVGVTTRPDVSAKGHWERGLEERKVTEKFGEWLNNPRINSYWGDTNLGRGRYPEVQREYWDWKQRSQRGGRFIYPNYNRERGLIHSRAAKGLDFVLKQIARLEAPHRSSVDKHIRERNLMYFKEAANMIDRGDVPAGGIPKRGNKAKRYPRQTPSWQLPGSQRPRPPGEGFALDNRDSRPRPSRRRGHQRQVRNTGR